MKIPPPILEHFYNQRGDDDGDDHEHEDEQRPYTRWRLATNSDGSPLLVCIQCTEIVTTEVARVVSHGRLFEPIPTPVAGYSGWLLSC